MSETAISTCHLLRAPAGRLLRGDEADDKHLLYGCTKGYADIEFTYEFLPRTPDVADIEFTYEFQDLTVTDV